MYSNKIIQVKPNNSINKTQEKINPTKKEAYADLIAHTKELLHKDEFDSSKQIDTHYENIFNTIATNPQYNSDSLTKL